jgi:hypothetical protein
VPLRHLQGHITCATISCQFQLPARLVKRRH